MNSGEFEKSKERGILWVFCVMRCFHSVVWIFSLLTHVVDFFSMFIGEHAHNIDPKKRLALPSKFRGELGESVVVTRGLDQCLFVYPMAAWQELAEKLGTMPIGESQTRSFVRLMLAGATDTTMDSQGRVIIPDYLREYAGLEKNVVVAGLFNRLEIWDERKWNGYKEAAEKNTDRIAEELGKLGVY